MACHPPIGEVKGQCRGKKADQKEKDSRVPVLPDKVEESFSIRQGSMILPLRVRFPWHEIHHKARAPLLSSTLPPLVADPMVAGPMQGIPDRGYRRLQYRTLLEGAGGP
jgi:hypothetical protein